jgi:hypothetical protein
MTASTPDHGWSKDDAKFDAGVTAILDVCKRDVVFCTLEGLKIR